MTAIVFSRTYNMCVYFFCILIHEKLMSVRSLTKQQRMVESVCHRNWALLQRVCKKKKKSFCSYSCSLYVFKSLPSHFFKQTGFSHTILYSFMSFSLFMPRIFICCFLIAREGRQDAPLGTDGFLEIYQQGLLLE